MDNVRRYELRHGTQVVAQPTAEPYESTIRQSLQQERVPDVFYAQRGEASRWYDLGLIRPIDDLPGLNAIRAQMQPALVEDSIAWDGRFLGLTYYNGGPFCLFRNERLLGAVGIRPTDRAEDYPTTWEEIERQALLIRDTGHCEHPLLMSWFDSHTGLAWNFIAQCHAEGEDFVDRDFAATFGPDSPFAKVLADWSRWYGLGLVPPDSFEWDDARLRAAWMSGSHVFHPTLDYHSATYTDSRVSRIHAHNHMNPVFPGCTCRPVLTGHPLLCVSNRERTDSEIARVWSFLTYMGGHDLGGGFTVHRRWVLTSNFEVPFPQIYSEPEVQSALRGWMYAPLAEVSVKWLLKNRFCATAAPIMRAPWYHDWDGDLKRIVIGVVRDRAMSTVEAAKALRNQWNRLRDQSMRGKS